MAYNGISSILATAVTATIVGLALAGSAKADSCEGIVQYSMNHMISEGANASEVARAKEVYLSTCQLAPKARSVLSKESFTSKVLAASSESLEKGHMPDAASTNTLVARIAYDYADAEPDAEPEQK